MPYRDRLEQRDDAGTDDIVTVASYVTILEAEMSRQYLEAHGVRAFSQDAASFNPLLSVAAGGARVLVRGADEGRARWFLERVSRTPATGREDDDEEGDVRCPRCELTYCFQEKAFSNGAQQLALDSPVLALFVLPFRARRLRWRCHKCLHVWEDAAEGPRRATPLDPDDPRPVFRWRSRRTGLGVMMGLVLMVGVWGIAAAVGAKSLFFLALGLIPLPVGILLGARVVVDVCSAHHCRAVLPAEASECPSCHGTVAGVIEFAHQHHAGAAQFRRELRAAKQARAKKRRAKKRRAPRPDG